MILNGKVLGDAALTKQFLSLSELAKSKIIRQATNYAMTPVLQEARSRTPVSKEPHRTSYTLTGKKISGNLKGKGLGRFVMPGFLKRSLIKKTSQSKNRYVTRTKVGAAGNEAYYGLFIERGYKRGPRKIPPNKFLQESLAARSNEVVARYRKKMREAIARETLKRK